MTFLRTAAGLLTFFTLFASHAVSAQEACVTRGDTLTQARDNYTSQCTLQRVDCDPFDGVWYCASFRLNSATAPAVTTGNAPLVPATPTPVTPVPATVSQTPAPPPIPAAPAPSAPAPVAAPPAPQIASTNVVRPACVRSDSDSDGDGFGWENNATCLVSGNSIATPANRTQVPAASTTAPVAQSAHPPCLRADSDSDGDGFGWENNDTCLVTNSSVSQPPPLAARPVQTNTANGFVTASDITDLILVTGQSNALGAGTTYDPSLDAPDNRVFAFTSRGWQVADLNQIWDLNWHPRNHPDTDPSNNFSLHFGKSVASADASRVTGFILATSPGSKIEAWNPRGSFYNSIQNKVLDAINQLPHKSAVDGILWHQGESDGQDSQAYTDALYTLIASFRNEPWVQMQAPFICGETKIAAVNRRLNGLNRDSDPNTACVRGIDLSTRGDDRHFDARALRTLGARYAASYLDITR